MAEPASVPGRPAIDAGEYDDSYFLEAAEGHREFIESRGRRLGARFRRVLALADVRPGQRVLDVGCGRGELVIQCALRGAYAVGIDYAEAALRIAAEAIASYPEEVRSRCQVRAMDARRLEFADASFDTVLMTDVVEHLAPRELDAALDEAGRVLRPGGRLVVRTSPNRLLLDLAYPAYIRRVHQVVAAACRLARVHDSVFSADLPTAPTFPRTDYERRLHINEQSPSGLRASLLRHGFVDVRLRFWEPVAYPTRWSLRLKTLDFLRFLRPISLFPPLNRFFCNHILATARRPYNWGGCE